MIGGILFLIVALVIGAINDSFGMSIPFDMRVAENSGECCSPGDLYRFFHRLPVVEGGDNSSLGTGVPGYHGT